MCGNGLHCFLLSRLVEAKKCAFIKAANAIRQALDQQHLANSARKKARRAKNAAKRPFTTQSPFNNYLQKLVF